MPRVLYNRWLQPGDARAVARVERKMYPRVSRSGASSIRFDLRRARRDDTNLSLGLYDCGRLVGYLLAYVRADRGEAFEEFAVRHPDAAAVRGPGIYVEDIVILPSHSKHLLLMGGSWLREIERLHPELPMDAFCRPELLERWRKHTRAWRLAGFALQDPIQVVDLLHEEDWFWLSWRRVTPSYKPRPRDDRRPGTIVPCTALPPGDEARLIETEADWARLRPDWERLTELMPEAGGSLAFQSNIVWWRQLGLSCRLLIVVLYRQDEVVGIAPLMTAPELRMRRPLRVLRFIGEVSLSERPSVIRHPELAEAPDLLWRAVLALRGRWDAALLYEQVMEARSHALLRALEPRDLLVRLSPPHHAPYVTLDGSWEAYLAERSAPLRKAFRRKLRRLREAGSVCMVTETQAPNAAGALEKYMHVERRSWKHAAHQGVRARPGHLDYYRALCAAIGDGNELHFRFLYLDEISIAATFGMLSQGRFASLEICHDEAFDRYSPGMLLTGLELEELHARSDCREYDFLTGTLDNKSSWANGVRTTRDLYLLPNDLRGRVDAFVTFRLRRAARRWLMASRLHAPAMRIIDHLKRPGTLASRVGAALAAILRSSKPKSRG